jgi:predicted nucleotidyltransferase
LTVSLDALYRRLPALVTTRLDALVAGLRAGLGDELHAVLVFGSAARGGFVADDSDVDVIVVLNSDPRARLEAIGTALDIARASARIECMLLRVDELQASADVFPLLYDDVRDCHVMLHGHDPFAGLVIHDHHRRLRIEQELREMRMRLRRVITDHVDDPLVLVAALLKKRKQLRSPLLALLTLQQAKSATDSIEDVLRAAGAHFAVDVSALVNIPDVTNAAAVAAVDALRLVLDAAMVAVEADQATAAAAGSAASGAKP